MTGVVLPNRGAAGAPKSPTFGASAVESVAGFVYPKMPPPGAGAENPVELAG